MNESLHIRICRGTFGTYECGMAHMSESHECDMAHMSESYGMAHMSETYE